MYTHTSDFSLIPHIPREYISLVEQRVAITNFTDVLQVKAKKAEIEMTRLKDHFKENDEENSRFFQSTSDVPSAPNE